MFFGRKKKEEIKTEERVCPNNEFHYQTVINGETAIKPYYYLRNGLLHVRYTVDRCIKLSKDEELKIKEELSMRPALKQDVLGSHWNLLTRFVEKEIIQDGLAEGYERSQELAQKYREEHGLQN